MVVTARIESDPRGDSSTLVIIVRDTGAGASAERLRDGRAAGVGFNNVERRLQCHYGSAATLSVLSAAGEGTTVEIRLPVQVPAGARSVASRSAS